jgi:hypothetical protein
MEAAGKQPGSSGPEIFLGRAVINN